MSKYISIDNSVQVFLDSEVKKDERGHREETYSRQLKRLLNIPDVEA